MKKIIFLIIALMITACLQGPWSYNPEVRYVDRGILVNAYIVADRPLSDVCFERLYDLDETYTDAWAFFDSALVEVTGDYGSGVETVELLQNPEKPMCFLGPLDKLGQRGKGYTLDGVFWWDSAGTEVRSVLSGQAKIPQGFNINKTAWAPSYVLAENTNAIISENATWQEEILAYFKTLPDSVSAFLTNKYLKEVMGLGSDSITQKKWYTDNGAQIQDEIDSLLKVYTKYIQYKEGDTLSYLGGALNNTSHYYKMNASDDVGGILITHRIEKNNFSPETQFDEFTKTFRDLKASDLYYGSEIRRLIYYRHYVGNEYDIFDSIGVVNSWFKSGKNVLYFYATDSNYGEYTDQNIQDESNSKVVKKSFITGANGIFTGMVVDSFEVNIRIPQNVLSYSKIESHAAYCEENNWGDKDCREYIYEYCESTAYNDRQYSLDNPLLFKKQISYNTCLSVLVEKSLDENKSSFDLIKSTFPKDGWPVKANDPKVDTLVKFNLDELKYAEKIGLEQHCFKNNFSTPACADLIDLCQSFSSTNDCRNNLWNYCVDNKWTGPSCSWGLHMYCLQSDVKSEILCGERNNNFCQNSPQENVCKLES